MQNIILNVKINYAFQNQFLFFMQKYFNVKSHLYENHCV